MLNVHFNSKLISLIFVSIYSLINCESFLQIDYIGYIMFDHCQPNNSESCVFFKYVDGLFPMKCTNNDKFYCYTTHFTDIEKELVPYHIIYLNKIASPSAERVYIQSTSNGGSFTNCDGQSPNPNCKFIYKNPSIPSKNNKHYVMWHLNVCRYIDSNSQFATRVRFFEHLDEARNFYKKVSDKIISVNNSYVILVSKEGKIIIPNHVPLNNSTFDICQGSNGLCRTANKVDFFSNNFGNLCP